MTPDSGQAGRFAGTALKLPSGPVRSQSSEPIDLLALAGPSVSARAVPVATVGVIVAMAGSPRASLRWALAAIAAALVAVLARQGRAGARR